LDELQALKTVLSETHANILTSNDFKEAFDGQQSALLMQFGGNMTQQTSISSMISACKKELEKLLDSLNKHLGGSQFGWQRLKGALLAGRTRETVQAVHRECQALNNLINISSLSLNVRIHKEVTQARKEQQAWWTNQESMAILDWLTPVNYGSQQSDFIRRRQEGTGTWLLDSAEFRLWVEEKGKTLSALAFLAPARQFLRPSWWIIFVPGLQVMRVQALHTSTAIFDDTQINELRIFWQAFSSNCPTVSPPYQGASGLSMINTNGIKDAHHLLRFWQLSKRLRFLSRGFSLLLMLWTSAKFLTEAEPNSSMRSSTCKAILAPMSL
jgi:hypothetical protein